MADVACGRCGQTRAALDVAPLPGKWGPVVQQHTCAECWRDWIEEQTRLINHEGLRPGQAEHRAVLYERMREFLKLST